MKQFALMFMIVIGLYELSFAHKGHDNIPGAIVAPHGGVIKGTDLLHLELVNESGGVKIYPLSHDLAPLSVKEITLQGTVSFPKKAKAEPVTFIVGEDYFSTKVDAKGAHRYSLDLVVTYQKKKEKIKFQVEPQS